MPVNSRAKGARNELACIRYIEEFTGIAAERNHSQTSKGGHDLLGIPYYAVEVKAYNKYTESDRKRWWQQAVRQAQAVDLEPAVFYRGNREDWKVMVAEPHALKNNIYTIDDFRIVSTICGELWCSLLSERLQPQEAKDDGS